MQRRDFLAADGCRLARAACLTVGGLVAIQAIELRARYWDCGGKGSATPFSPGAIRRSFPAPQNVAAEVTRRSGGRLLTWKSGWERTIAQGYRRRPACELSGRLAPSRYGRRDAARTRRRGRLRYVAGSAASVLSAFSGFRTAHGALRTDARYPPRTAAPCCAVRLLTSAATMRGPYFSQPLKAAAHFRKSAHTISLSFRA